MAHPIRPTGSEGEGKKRCGAKKKEKKRFRRVEAPVVSPFSLADGRRRRAWRRALDMVPGGGVPQGAEGGRAMAAAETAATAAAAGERAPGTEVDAFRRQVEDLVSKTDQVNKYQLPQPWK